jgi:hypothetical protein
MDRAPQADPPWFQIEAKAVTPVTLKTGRLAADAGGRSIATNIASAVLLGAKPLRMLREYHDTPGEHQQTDNLEQHQ